MTVDQLQQLFMWCSIFNIGILTVAFLAILAFRSKICRIHSRMFRIPEEAVNLAIYSFFGIWKLLAFLFFVFPWLALYLVK